MKIKATKIDGLLIIEPDVFHDERGWFSESFNQEKFEKILRERDLNIPQFVQDNHSFSQKGVLRGLHYQEAPYAQGKLVRVIQGRAWDIAVDIRENSETYLEWVGIELTADNHKQFWIPEGFAHGFLALEDHTHFLYKTTSYYHPASERTIAWNDDSLNIQWPLHEIESLKLNQKDLLAGKIDINDGNLKNHENFH